MDMREAHVVDPELEVLSMLRDRQLMIVSSESEGKVALELLLVTAKLAISENAPASREL